MEGSGRGTLEYFGTISGTAIGIRLGKQLGEQLATADEWFYTTKLACPVKCM